MARGQPGSDPRRPRAAAAADAEKWAGAAAEAVAAEAARGGGPGGGVVGVGMDRARRRQLQEPALETEPRRWRRRRLSVVSPPLLLRGHQCPQDVLEGEQ